MKIIKRLSIASVPLLFLILLLTLSYVSANQYIQCSPKDCKLCEKNCQEIDPSEDCQTKCLKNGCKKYGEKEEKCEPLTYSLDNILMIARDTEKTKQEQEQLKAEQEQPSAGQKTLKQQREELIQQLSEPERAKLQLEELNKQEEKTNKQEELEKQKKTKNQEITALKLSGRATFIFLLNLYFLICFIAAGASLYIIYKSLKEGVFFGWKNDVYYTRLVLAIIVLITGLGIWGLFCNSDIFMSLFHFLLTNLIKEDLPQAEWLLRSVNSFGFSVCFMLYVAVCLVLYSPLRRSNPEGLLEASKRMRYLRTILYLGTLLLVVGTLLIRSVYQWSLALMPRSEQAIKTAESFFSSLLSVQGGFFTLMLAAAYLPAAFILYWQATQTDGLPQADAEKEKELQKYNLTFSFTESLPKIIAILGPILAGTVGELFTKLIK